MKSFKVVVTDHQFDNVDIERKILGPIGAEVLDIQTKDKERLIEHCKDADAILNLYAKITSEVINELDKCKIIVRYGVGFENVDLPSATEKGIYVANVRDYGNHEVSTHAIALLLACARKILQLNNSVKSNNWDFTRHKPIFRLWENQVLGLLGFGKIARHTSSKAQAFGLKVIAYDPYVTSNQMAEYGISKVQSLDDLLMKSDYISIHAPLNEDTFHVMSEKQFRLMKRTAYIINTSRGPLIDELALLKALKNKWIAGAGLDVMEEEPPKANNPLMDFDNVIITPHTAYYSEEAMIILRNMASEQVLEVLKHNKPPRFLVNTKILQ